MTDQLEEIAPEASDVASASVANAFVANQYANEHPSKPPPKSPARFKITANTFGDLVLDIESLTKPDAIARVDFLREKCDRTYFELGGVLSLIRRNKWFEQHESFKEYVKSKLVVGYRSALIFAELYDKVSELGLPFSQFKGLGWTTMRLLAPILTKKNAEHWIKQAHDHSRRELAKLIEEAASASPGGDQSVAKPKTANPNKIKFNGDQMKTVGPAIARAKLQSGAEDAAQAIVYALKGYLNQPTLTQQLSSLPPVEAIFLLTKSLKKYDDDSVLKIMKLVCAGRSGIHFG